MYTSDIHRPNFFSIMCNNKLKIICILLLSLVALFTRQLAIVGDARIWDPSISKMKLKGENYHILAYFGYDEFKINMYRRRSLENKNEDDIYRVTPGGPESQHHSLPPPFF